MTSLIPGHKPPQVTIAQEVLAGSKKILRRGPANSNAGSRSWCQCAANTRQRIIQKNLVFVRNENLHFASLSPMSLHGGFDRALPKGRHLKIGGRRRSHCELG